MAQSDTEYQTQRYTFSFLVCPGWFDRYRTSTVGLYVSPDSIKPDTSTQVVGTVYEIRGYHFTRNAVTMAQSDTEYQTQRYTFSFLVCPGWFDREKTCTVG
jgi:translation elongation factor EF-Tu-like GTPase